MGLYVSIRPPTKRGWVHWAWFSAFATLGVIAAFTNYQELHSSSELQASLLKQQGDLLHKQGQLSDGEQNLISAQNSFSATQTETNAKIKEATASIDKLRIEQKSNNPTQRKLSNKDIQNLIYLLKPFAHLGVKINISCLVGDSNGCHYAEQWLNVLREAKWVADGVSQSIWRSPPVGVFIVVKANQTPGGGILQHAFSTVGIKAGGQIDEKIPADQINLIIGGNS